MHRAKRVFTKSWVLLLAASLILASAMALTAGIQAAQAAGDDRVAAIDADPQTEATTAPAQPDVQITEEPTPAPTIEAAQPNATATPDNNFTITEQVNEDMKPSEKDLTKEEAVDAAVKLAVILFKADLQGITVDVFYSSQSEDIVSRSMWVVLLHNPNDGMIYDCMVDSVTGEAFQAIKRPDEGTAVKQDNGNVIGNDVCIAAARIIIEKYFLGERTIASEHVTSDIQVGDTVICTDGTMTETKPAVGRVQNTVCVDVALSDGAGYSFAFTADTADLFSFVSIPNGK